MAPTKTDSGTPLSANAANLAQHALGHLVSRRQTQIVPALVDALELAVTDRSAEAWRDVSDQMQREGIHPTQICDDYVPEVARRLGELWTEDELSFAGVTIACSRLQAMLRDLSPEEPPDTSATGTRLLLVVIADTMHTLGAMVLTGQLRRQGASVKLMLGRSLQEISATLGSGSYHGALLSVALRDELSDLQATIKDLRGANGNRIPIIVGGSITELGINRVKVATGADLVTNDIREALRFVLKEMSGEAAG
ncbi:cobalamin B12-binding domain-containing protein [Palleronia caenipelagi]|uniref:Cobalamin B12-binding domain-containing protein n=1 Tax=Palleronia caenipelagi TaxID=2489174 RepID=A0A547Q884_9RHOB|nr:cobalamin B12-binding domain-containing protein [Palleronia caenipelagi]TRD22594.1 cobalamin B12-binding domain-containing protein [Palleronia caenipelagi]